MEEKKCCRCLCAHCGNEAGCENYCEMKEPCSHDAVINCHDYNPDHSEFDIGQSRYLACCYSLSAIEAFQTGQMVEWEDVKSVLRLALGDPEE